MPIDPAMFGLTPGGPAGMPGMPGMGGGDGMATPGMESNPMSQMAVSALDQLMPKSPNPTAAMQKVEQAFDLAYKLVMTALPQLAQWNPKITKDAHAAARMLISLKGEIRKEAAPGIPPDLMLGMGSGPGAAPPMGSPAPMIGGGGAGL